MLQTINFFKGKRFHCAENNLKLLQTFKLN